MSEQNLNNSDSLLLESDANLHAEPCLACRKVSSELATPYYSFDQIRLEGRELWTSTQNHCNWCASLWGEITRRSPFREMNESSLQQLDIAYYIMLDKEEDVDSGAVSRIIGRLTCRVWPSLARLVEPCCFELEIVSTSENLDVISLRYEIPERTSSPSSHILASQWISNCTQNHEKCCIDKISWLPTRLVNVGLDGVVTRLVETKEISKDQNSQYFALSHRWGATPDHSSRLSSINKLAWMESIPADQMPATFQDAIQFTRNMNIPYIWIDSLCIMQDSSEDWSTEAALMDKVYAQSLCNIAASYASSEESPNKRLFHTRTRDYIDTLSVKQKFFMKKNHQGLYGLSPNSNYVVSRTDFALYKRAWVLQERLLSPRTIHFSKQLMWECREKRASEAFPMGISLIACNFFSRDLLKDWRSGLQEQGYKFWYHILGEYVNCSLTYSSDRLVAIGAIAREFQIELNDVYLAGLWKKELPFNLLWKIDRGSSFPSRPVTYRCPTWSWVSLDISYPARMCVISGLKPQQVLVKIVEAKIFSPLGRAYTQYHAGHIRLKGKLYSIGSKDADEWLCVDDHGVFLGGEKNLIASKLDIKIRKSEGSRIYLIPIATVDWLINNIECLVLRSVSMGSMVFNRVGSFSFNPWCLGEGDTQLHVISQFATAKDPFLGDLETITII
ncbi:hypothetical protein BPAE_0014g00670 [Botrytis paeoniae]|uniref:Heterokaryon incompatibility domain-containing protein n=1 Tax=Botrytis paeoniae TaxID=278948 RepID=A0A4Z1FXS8_9HELO|nr:hypothetical protein BPAE_0014g00670 [Botrytis paeoniae]